MSTFLRRNRNHGKNIICVAKRQRRLCGVELRRSIVKQKLVHGDTHIWVQYHHSKTKLNKYIVNSWTGLQWYGMDLLFYIFSLEKKHLYGSMDSLDMFGVYSFQACFFLQWNDQLTSNLAYGSNLINHSSGSNIGYVGIFNIFANKFISLHIFLMLMLMWVIIWVKTLPHKLSRSHHYETILSGTP